MFREWYEKSGIGSSSGQETRICFESPIVDWLNLTRYRPRSHSYLICFRSLCCSESDGTSIASESLAYLSYAALHQLDQVCLLFHVTFHRETCIATHRNAHHRLCFQLSMLIGRGGTHILSKLSYNNPALTRRALIGLLSTRLPGCSSRISCNHALSAGGVADQWICKGY